jgi:hypothetical protein
VFLFENIRSRTFRVLKINRGFIQTKRGDINPPKNWETAPGPLGAFLVFLTFLGKISKVVLGFRNFGYDF